MVKAPAHDEMNAPSLYHITINSSNSDQARSPVASNRVEVGADMNREISHDDDPSRTDKQQVPLKDGFVPGDNDVLCGRGKKCYAHTGNERFRQIVHSYLEQYSAASSRPEKSEILSLVVNEVRKRSPDGGFVKQNTDTGKWYEVGDFLAREKTSQAFRDALHEHYRSSKKSKHEKRRQRTKAKAMMEKAAKAPRQELDSHLMDAGLSFPPLHASPLVSREHLTALREELPHPRAFSFSGHSPDGRARGMPARAMSLSSGRGGGRLPQLFHPGSGNVPPRERFSRAESEPIGSLYHEPSFDLEDMAAYRHQERMATGHDSWPQSFQRSSPRHEAIDPTVSFHASAPQFHPVCLEDVAAYRNFPDRDDAVMVEADRALSRSLPPQMPSWPRGESECEVPDGQGIMSHNMTRMRSSFAAEMPVDNYGGDFNTMGASSAMTSTKYQEENLQPFSLQRPTPVNHHARNESTAAATAIVAQLSSALPSEQAPIGDENPFEPIPLAGRAKKARTARNEHEDKWLAP